MDGFIQKGIFKVLIRSGCPVYSFDFKPKSITASPPKCLLLVLESRLMTTSNKFHFVCLSPCPSFYFASLPAPPPGSLRKTEIYLWLSKSAPARAPICSPACLPTCLPTGLSGYWICSFTVTLYAASHRIECDCLDSLSCRAESCPPAVGGLGQHPCSPPLCHEHLLDSPPHSHSDKGICQADEESELKRCAMHAWKELTSCRGLEHAGWRYTSV